MFEICIRCFNKLFIILVYFIKYIYCDFVYDAGIYENLNY